MSTHEQDRGTIHQEVTVPVPVERAFAIFTEQFDRIKPREHNLLAVPIEETVFETRVGGHVYDRGVDGTECRWARVLVFEPPERFVISWDIGPTWQLESDPGRTSEVEVRFLPLDGTGTRVVLEHRHLERHGAGWEQTLSALQGGDGWPTYLDRFVAQASS